MSIKMPYRLLALLVLVTGVVVACGAPAEPETIIVTQIVEVEKVVEVEKIVQGEQVVVTQIVQEEVIKEVEVEKIVEVTVAAEEAMMEDQPVTLNLNWGTEPPTIDPSLATDTTSVAISGSLFVGLTQFDPVTNEVVPYLATSWEQGTDADGNETWTFTLREDIAWVVYNPVTGETTQAMDEEGNPRFVNANDVVYGTQRTLNPDTGSDYSYVLYGIKNGASVNEGSEEVTMDDLGVVALDDTTVQYTLENPAGYFGAIASMWVNYPQPSWAIEEWGDAKWTEAGLIVSNGPYVLDSWIHGGELNLVKNPLWVDADNVQIERIEGIMIEEESTAFALYENNELDLTGVPSPELDRVKVDAVLGEEYRSAPLACTYYYGFNNQKYPFTDQRVRLAFSQAIDRSGITENVNKVGQPASSFAPPGIFGAPVPGTVGVFHSPDEAVENLQAFLDDEGLTLEDFNGLGVTLMHNTSEGHARIAAAVQQMWADTLGVDVNVENQEWAVYLDTIGKTTPIDEAPHVYRLGWCADYPDENNWVHEVFNAEAGSNRLRRNCTDANCSDAGTAEFDDITSQAQAEQDPAVRTELYAQAEQILAFDEAAYAPIYHYESSGVVKPWLIRNYPTVGGPDYWNWTLDMEAKLASQ